MGFFTVSVDSVTVPAVIWTVDHSGFALAGATMIEVVLVPLQFDHTPVDCIHAQPPSMSTLAVIETCSVYVPWSR